MKTLSWLLVLCLFSVMRAAPARAQETVFNVPSADILEKGKLYLETDFYDRWWKSDAGKAGSAYLRGVYGVAKDVEAGINTGPQDLYGGKTAFMDATLKVRPLSGETWNLCVGGNAGVGVEGPNRGEKRYLGYAAAYKKLGPVRIGAGGYSATQRVFSDRTQSGGLATLEYPVPGVPGLSLAADWFSGVGGYASPGLVYVRGPLALYAAWGFSNDDRSLDLPTLEVGWTF